MKRPVIITVKRSAIGKVGGMFKHLEPEQLVAPIIKHIIETYQIDRNSIDEVILGNAIGPGGNIARVAALHANLPVEIPAITLDRQCGSGLEAINYACRLIQASAGDMYLAGGVESSSLAPWRMAKPKSLYEMPQLYDRAPFSTPEIGDPSMGIAADNVAKAFHISREAQDEFAYWSHQKAIHAQEENVFADEIVPIHGKTIDEGPRKALSLSFLRRLKPAFSKGGTVTAGNACPINDGAAIALIMSSEKAKTLGLQPKLHFIDATSAGVDPNILGIGPVPAVKKLLHRQNLHINDIGLVEFNEAFASQVLASMQALQIKETTLNKSGGAIAFGHPYGASGAILVSRLCTEIERTNTKYALATLGIAGGLGLATLFAKDSYNNE